MKGPCRCVRTGAARGAVLLICYGKADRMKIIIGLGNPGREYMHTRHNVGFDVVEILSRKLNIPIKKLKCHAVLGEGTVGGNKTVLVLPQTFMNLSGQTVAELLSWYKCAPEDILIIHDDIDLPFGQVRIRPHGGAGTHNGMRNILFLTGSDRFPRIRIGVGKPPAPWDLKDWVLSSYRTEEERKIAYDAYCLAADAAECFASSGIDLCMNRFNGRAAETKTKKEQKDSTEGKPAEGTEDAGNPRKEP